MLVLAQKAWQKDVFSSTSMVFLDEGERLGEI